MTKMNLSAPLPFEGCTKREFNAHMNYSSGYTNIMLFKKQDSYIDKMAA